MSQTFPSETDIKLACGLEEHCYGNVQHRSIKIDLVTSKFSLHEMEYVDGSRSRIHELGENSLSPNSSER